MGMLVLAIVVVIDKSSSLTWCVTKATVKANMTSSQTNQAVRTTLKTKQNKMKQK